MKKKLIPENKGSWLETKIKKITFEVASKSMSSVCALYKYIPYKYGSNSFSIPKSPERKYETCDSGLAIPPKELWLGYSKTKEEYLSLGEEHVKKMLELVRASNYLFNEGDRILDFGCGGGRMIRHLKNLSVSREIWGTDIQAECIYWCKQYLSPPFHFATTTTAPHLPFEDRYFNFIYAGSVFTHIDDLAEAWLLELRRILAPDGRLFLTIQDYHSIDFLKKSWPDFFLTKIINTNNLYAQSKNTFGMLTIGRGNSSHIFYDIDYFCKTLGSVYQVLSITEEAYSQQTAVLLKRKSEH